MKDSINRYEEILKRLEDQSYEDLTELKNLVNIKLFVGEYQSAIAFLRLATFHHPDDPTLWMMLAEAFYNKGDHQRAVAAYREAYRLGCQPMGSSGEYITFSQAIN